MRRRLVACVLGAALLGGCGEEADTSTELTTYEVASAGFAAAVPRSWETASVDDPAERGDWPALEQAPTLRPYLEALREPDPTMKFVAFDPEVRDAFATNLNVVVERLDPGMSFETYARTLIAQLELVPVVVGDITSDDVELPAGDAVRASYRLKLTAGGATKTVSTLQYVVGAGRAAYTLTYTTLPVLAGDYEAAFEDSARAFRLLEKR